MGYDGSVGEVLLFGIPILWLAILLGCCWMCGWIHATKRGPDRIKPPGANGRRAFPPGPGDPQPPDRVWCLRPDRELQFL